MGNRCHIFNTGHPESRCLKCGHSTFASTTRAVDFHLYLDQTHLSGLARGGFSSTLSGEGGALAGTLEADLSRRFRHQNVAVDICDRDKGVVERRLDVGNALGDVPSNLLGLFAWAIG